MAMTPSPARTRVLLRPPATLRIPRAALEAWSGPLLVYGALSAVAVATALARGRNPIATEAWFAALASPAAIPCAAGAGAGLGTRGTPPLGGGGVGALAPRVSLVGGAALAFATVKATRFFVQTWSWARALHNDLRPAVRHSGTVTLVVLGVASAASEELFFRGLLATTFGLIVSSLAFGLLHQTRGRMRWVWAGWATVMGVLFGSLFLATGSLLGPLLAHAAINVANLRYIRDTDVEAPKPRRLGGLLGRS